jgi:2-succinyl-5-enolpyruvyl-6-hydroxy-3-cyclohexene-1-carboxylate synthase
MYTIQENVRIVIAMLKQYGIHHIVISPGGTNIPISQAVQDDTFFHCYSVPDERSAYVFCYWSLSPNRRGNSYFMYQCASHS